jgi:hypothetical protein
LLTGLTGDPGGIVKAGQLRKSRRFHGEGKCGSYRSLIGESAMRNDSATT